MRLTLIDLLILAGLVLLGSALAPLAIPPGQLPRYAVLLIQAAAGVVTYVVIASFIYRRMLFWPLLFPVCPHCRKQPRSFEATGAWPTFTMSCGSCNGQTELRMHAVNDADADHQLPCLQLRWPYFLGWYKRVR